jgi:DNA-binding response OmpR family regulator
MRHRILIVENEPELLMALRDFFEVRGYEVHLASEREEAETLLHNYSYSVVIADLSLSRLGAEGLEVIMSASDRPAPPKVIAITGHSGWEYEKAAREHGADAFMRKPASLHTLADVVEGLLQEVKK